MHEDIEIPLTCEWEEVKNNPDWFHVSCINRKINIWKQCKKKHITPFQMFLSCPYCGNKVDLKEDKK